MREGLGVFYGLLALLMAVVLYLIGSKIQVQCGVHYDSASTSNLQSANLYQPGGHPFCRFGDFTKFASGAALVYAFFILLLPKSQNPYAHYTGDRIRGGL